MLWIVLIIAVAALVHYLITKPYSFFKKRGLEAAIATGPYKNIYLMIFGKINMVKEQQKLYKQKPNKRCFPVIMTGAPSIMIRDPELLKQITVKDFEYYTDHVDIFFKEDVDPIIGKSLIALKGKRWHEMRTTLSPSFSGSKMRIIFNLMNECGEELGHYLKKLTVGLTEPLELEFREVTKKFTNDMIATTAFGIKVNSFEHPDNEFFSSGQSVTSLNISKFMLIILAPKLAKLLGITLLPKKVIEFLTRMVLDTVATRERENIYRPDMLQLLIELKKQQNENPDANTKSELTDGDMIAQSAIFFLAGFDPVSITLSFALYEITLNPDIQTKLQAEIDDVVAVNKTLTYDVLKKMKYLDMVVSETLRKWPAAFMIDRTCTKTHTLDTGDGEIILVEPTMNIQVPTFSIHHDPENFSNPEIFDPERFSEERKDSINPAAYIPFGSGPRMCIANRFALLESKVMLFHLFANFNFHVTKKTPIPMEIKDGPTNLDSKHGFWLGITTRQKA